ncbi:hypothetical protein SpAn4DRAFT_0133 [Sporomusa ovata]|uniref:Uncharacterized protein n=1 Tax=Sporomusa ovata TaxID=2378 RepID=A0A0U1L1Z6_9FIRM|nr:hypothetical protein SpAn4DRAFT_0133 [Sporomusa ovata]
MDADKIHTEEEKLNIDGHEGMIMFYAKHAFHKRLRMFFVLSRIMKHYAE